jgi:hypothetical protein
MDRELPQGWDGCPRCEALEQRLREMEKRLAELEDRLRANSSNSSTAPSASPPWAPKLQNKKPTGKPPGGQKGHQGHCRKLLPVDQVDEVVLHAPRVCDYCQAELNRGMGQVVSRHQIAELPQRAVTFARVAGIEPTNNHAERMLRPAVIWRKKSLGCHSQGGCRYVERMLSAIQTLRLQNRSILSFLADTLHAHRYGLPLPAVI